MGGSGVPSRILNKSILGLLLVVFGLFWDAFVCFGVFLVVVGVQPR